MKLNAKTLGAMGALLTSGSYAMTQGHYIVGAVLLLGGGCMASFAAWARMPKSRKRGGKWPG